MATIDNNNLPKGVTLINPGKYLVTNSKGQSRTVYSDTATQLNQYNDSWQTGKPTTITGIVNPNDGRIMPPMQFNPANIIGQEQATNEYFANYTALRKADLVPNKDGTYSSRTTGEKLTDAEIQQKVAAAGLPPNTLEIQKNNGKFNPVPSSESVEASTAALNNVSNIPSGAQPAPAAPLSGTSNSPLTVNSQLGATIVKEEPTLVQNAAATNQNIQADPEARTREQRAQDKIDAAALAKNNEQQNIVGQQVNAQSKIIRSADSTDAQKDAAIIERDKLRLQGQALRTEEEVLTKQDPATSLYTGVDRNTGQQQYYNKATGKYYLSDTPPTTEQQAKVKDPASGFINQSSENIVSPPAVATAQVPVKLDPPDSVTDSTLVQNAAAPVVAPPLAEAPAVEAPAVAAPAAAPPVAQSMGTPYVYPDERGGTGGVSNDVPVAKKQVQDNDPEGNANVREQQNAAANEEAIRNGQESVNLNPQGITTAKREALNSGQDFKSVPDWRVRLSLAPGANYLYNVGSGAAGILNPLKETDGVIFPYTPAISVAYAANYTPFDPTHSNYKIYQYTNSSVDSFSITCDFTAQDTTEANYLLAVIHFFKSITKMFYGQDQNPKPGTPPPLCYLSGLGEFQFDNHPLAITGFTYQLPIDVDYIRALPQPAISGAGQPTSIPAQRLLTSGASDAPPKFSSGASTGKPTYVPTKMQITITAHPIVSRNNISNKFSLKEYATGQLLLGKSRKSGGIW